MATKAPDPTMTGPNYASAEYAEQWRHDDLESRLAARDQVENAGSDDRADHLRDDIRQEQLSGKRPPAHRPIDTAGLKWPPEIGPKA